MKQFTNTLLLAIAASFFASCSTTQKQRGKALDFFSKHPQELAAICGDKFPPIIKPGKDSIVHDTTITPGRTVECPPVVIKTQKGKDSVVYRYVQCPPDTGIKTIRTRVDTIENTAKIYSLQFDRDSLIKLVDIRATERDKAQKKAGTRLIWLFGLIGLFVIAVILKSKRII